MGKNAQMNWEDYRYFLALADTGSFSAAARELAARAATRRARRRRPAAAPHRPRDRRDARQRHCAEIPAPARPRRLCLARRGGARDARARGAVRGAFLVSNRHSSIS